MSTVVLSLKPRWAEEIFSGRKTVEVRRRYPLAERMNQRALIYTTAPVSALTGEMRIVASRKFSLDELLCDWTGPSCVPEDLMRDYLGDLGYGILLFIEDPKRRDNPRPLSHLRAMHGFTPPQSYAYASPLLMREVGEA